MTHVVEKGGPNYWLAQVEQQRQQPTTTRAKAARGNKAGTTDTAQSKAKVGEVVGGAAGKQVACRRAKHSAPQHHSSSNRATWEEQSPATWAQGSICHEDFE